jgi:stage II sporulation protein M
MWAAWRDFWLACWRQNWPLFLFVLAVFVLGIGFGALGVDNLSSGQFEELKKYVDAFVRQVGQLSIDSGSAVRSKIYGDILMIVLLYLFGLSFVGILFVLGLVFIRGFILGFAVVFLARGMALNGFLLVAVSILPHNLLYLPALLAGGTAALSFALLSVRRYYNTRIRLFNCLVGYTLIMLTVMIVILSAGLVEVYFSPWLTRMTAGLIETLALR